MSEPTGVVRKRDSKYLFIYYLFVARSPMYFISLPEQYFRVTTLEYFHARQNSEIDERSEIDSVIRRTPRQ